MRRRNEGERGMQKNLQNKYYYCITKSMQLFLTIDHKYILWSFRIIISVHLEDSTHSVDTCQQHITQHTTEHNILLNSFVCNYSRKWMLNNTQIWCIGLAQISTELPFLLKMLAMPSFDLATWAMYGDNTTPWSAMARSSLFTNHLNEKRDIFFGKSLTTLLHVFSCKLSRIM